MNSILLDGVGAGFLLFLFGLGLLFIIITIVLEAIVMRWAKYQPVFKKALLQSVVVNLVSLAAGFVLSGVSDNLFNISNISGFGLMFGVTIILEFALLYFMNKSTPLAKTLGVCLMMNLVTYAIAFLLLPGNLY